MAYIYLCVRSQSRQDGIKTRHNGPVGLSTLPLDWFRLKIKKPPSDRSDDGFFLINVVEVQVLNSGFSSLGLLFIPEEKSTQYHFSRAKFRKHRLNQIEAHEDCQ
jgi:hypothetical protein